MNKNIEAVTEKAKEVVNGAGAMAVEEMEFMDAYVRCYKEVCDGDVEKMAKMVEGIPEEKSLADVTVLLNEMIRKGRMK